MVLIEKKMDLFDADEKYYFVQCISADFAMGKGIAVEFIKKFNTKSKLQSMWKGQKPNYPQAILVDKVFNLVTKAKYYEKPTYKTIEIAIQDMKGICTQKNIKYLAMPKIGSGLDRLSWPKIRKIIQDVFKDTDIEILVCNI
ncbi:MULTISPECIES: macro domain-containing protein [Clostridium]|jgi:hypothetical protein|uniref:macro domain-containing protein n=1 Tax=Clostridium TaxID=1485 RepID=UPI002432D8E3|nr:macro domain-containing protein [Clostridium tyrobutyricum]